MRMKNHAYCTNRYDNTQNRFEYLPVHSRETRCVSRDSGTAVTNFWAVLYIWWTIKDQCLARKHFAWCSIGKQIKPWYHVNQKIYVNRCRKKHNEQWWVFQMQAFCKRRLKGCTCMNIGIWNLLCVCCVQQFIYQVY